MYGFPRKCFQVTKSKGINKMALDEKSTYYDAGGIEVFTIIRAKLTPEQLKGYYLGNVIKYSCRLNFKNNDSGLRDAEKIAIYNDLLKEHAERSEEKKMQNEEEKNFDGCQKIPIKCEPKI